MTVTGVVSPPRAAEYRCKIASRCAIYTFVVDSRVFCEWRSCVNIGVFYSLVRENTNAASSTHHIVTPINCTLYSSYKLYDFYLRPRSRDFFFFFLKSVLHYIDLLKAKPVWKLAPTSETCNPVATGDHEPRRDREIYFLSRTTGRETGKEKRERAFSMDIRKDINNYVVVL